MRSLRRYFLMGSLVGMSVGFQSQAAVAQEVVKEASRIVVVRNVKVQDGVVSGEIVNNSSQVLRDVELQIRYIWHWKDEKRPGKDAPGRTAYYRLEKEIAPGASASFTYTPTPPLPSRPDGYFETAVSVAGYTEIIR